MARLAAFPILFSSAFHDRQIRQSVPALPDAKPPGTLSLYQVTFSDQSMATLNKLAVEDQLKLVDRISNLSPDQLENPDDSIGSFQRNGRQGVPWCGRATSVVISRSTQHALQATTFFTVTSPHGLHLPQQATGYSRKRMAEEPTPSFWKYLESAEKERLSPGAVIPIGGFA